MTGQEIIKRFKQVKNEPERTNFNIIWQNAAEFCSPNNDNINKVSTPGSERNYDRYTDVGIKSNKTFASGLSSNLIPAGSEFFAYTTSDPNLKNDDMVNRYWSDVTAITYDVLNGSNFFQEANKCINQLGYIGTSCLLTDPSKETGVRFKSYFIDNFYIMEDAFNQVDTVFFEMNLTARQAYQLFGDKLSDKVKDDAQNSSKMNEKVVIIHVVEPRMDYEEGPTSKDKQPIKSCWVEEETSHLIKEGGYYEMPFAVARYQIGDGEKYGRSPAIDCLMTLGLINTMEQTRINAAELVCNPPLLVPNGSVHRTISNQPGAITSYDPSNGYKPEQWTLKNNVFVNDEAIRRKGEDVEDMFLVPLFDPLVNRQNMTAYEVNTRTVIATQNLVPAIGRLTNEFLAPIFKRIYHILERGGYYPSLPEGMSKDPKVAFSSKATMAIKQIKELETFQALENIMYLAQAKPEVLDNIDFDEVARLTLEAKSVPSTVQVSEFEVEQKRSQQAQQAQQEQAQMAMSNMADAYNKTSNAPEAGSAAEIVMNEQGL